MTEDLEDAKIEIRKSKVREEIVRTLYADSDLRPTEIFEKIEENVDTTKENFYQHLKALNGFILDKLEGSKRMTLYSLTDVGREAAEELGLQQDDEEQLRGFAYESSLSKERMKEIIDEANKE